MLPPKLNLIVFLRLAFAMACGLVILVLVGLYPADLPADSLPANPKRVFLLWYVFAPMCGTLAGYFIASLLFKK